MSKKKLIFNTINEQSDFLINQWVTLAEKKFIKNEVFNAALSGGKTPINFLNKLKSIDEKFWKITKIFLVDERYIPHNDNDSNYFMIKTELLDNIKINPDNIFPIKYLNNIDESVKDYNELLKNNFNQKFFDFVLLGIGEDGHTASLFPDTNFKNRNELAISVSHSKIKYQRISITLKVINNSKNIYFLVSGRNKVEIVNEIYNKNMLYPASYVKPIKGKLFFVLDRESGIIN